jgi:hypothetical protein
MSDGLFLQEVPYEDVVPVPCRGLFRVDRVAVVAGRPLLALIISWKFRSRMIGLQREHGRNAVKRKLWVIAGTICVGLGILGVFLPVLPTTPFLLLAAFCYGRGSERFYSWLVDRSRFGVYIRHYRQGLGIPAGQKIFTLALLWLTIGATALLAVTAWWLRALLALIAVGVTIHLLRIKTRKHSLDTTDSMGEKGNSVEPVPSPFAGDGYLE